MRALFNYQRDKYKAEWYRRRGEEPPDLTVKSTPTPYIPPPIMTLTTTTILQGNHNNEMQKNHQYTKPSKNIKSNLNIDQDFGGDYLEEENFNEEEEEFIEEEEYNENDGLSYWETENAGIEPFEFQVAKSVLQSDKVVSWKEHPPIGQGEITPCYTPYQNDQMTFQAFELARQELQRKTQELAEEMKRVDIIFNRPPKKNWFVKQKGVNFTIEHCRFLEMQRRRAQKFAHPE